MKILHILKTEPDSITRILMSAFSESDGAQTTLFELYHDQADYEKLIDLVFENDQIISWW
jgi:hypothetical protein